MSDPKDHNGEASGRIDLRLPSDVPPTKSFLTKPEWVDHIKKIIEVLPLEHDEIVGPFFRENAPYRGKVSAPYEPGTLLVIKGRVWAHDTKEPLAAKMDIWQADEVGRYDNEESGRLHAGPTFVNRARVCCDRTGHYEFETVHPGPYQRGEIWRAPHIHFRVSYTGYTTLITQLFFSGDPHLDDDPYREDSLVIQLQEVERNGSTYEEGVFDIVLPLAASTVARD